MVENNFLMQFQADTLNIPVVRPAIKETTALGAAYAAGLAVGYFTDLEDMRQNCTAEQTWEPHMEPSQREDNYRQWKKAVTRSFDWVE
jgi:glycerol kinase